MATERKVVGIEDLVLLNQLQNDAIVSNLQKRFGSNEIYTYIGPVLICCNPFQWLKLYENSFVKMYENGVRSDLAPHIFGVAESAFRTMLSEEEKQCVIISGESGAGKTEAAKQIMSFIAAVSGSGGNDRAVTEVKNIVLDSNPALEAFGNAMTLRNNNSSRFGKYFELKFDLSNGGTPRGGYITNYLLEKSRVVKPGPGERSFHIFYQLLRGAPADMKRDFALAGPECYNILRMSGVTEVNNEGGRADDDGKNFEETMHSMETVGISGSEQRYFFQVVAICLHLSNIDFVAANVNDAEGSQIHDQNALQSAAVLMEVDPETLAYALTYRTLTTMAPGGKVETYQVPMNPTQARAARDALAKDLYSRLFDLLVSRVNDALQKSGSRSRTSQRRLQVSGSEDPADGLSIGVLDIYGFEIFDQNKFEQFCINFVNEKLQNLFIELTIKSEQEDYASEGIQWVPIPFFDNKIVCELIEAKKPPGVFSILDDTCKTAHSLGNADDKFLEKLNTFQRGHKHYMKTRDGFTIKHYAGDVNYTGDGFIEANKDTLSQDLQRLSQSSRNEFVSGLYPDEIDLDQRRHPSTAGFKIKKQCSDLVYALMDCNPHYVRCIKSNDQKKAGGFDKERVTHQVRYLGLLENVKVRRAGFAYRMEFFRFINRFKVIGAGVMDPRVLAHGSDYDIAHAILDAASRSIPQLQQPGEAQLGRTKIFIKTPETFFKLQEIRKRMVGDQVVKIQKAWRRFANRRDLVDLRAEMSDLWNQQRKEATPIDLLRPYSAFYVSDKDLNSAISMLMEYYQLNGARGEKMEYTDIVKKMTKNGSFETTVFIISNLAIYTAVWVVNDNKGGIIVGSKKLVLRRRTAMNQVQSVGLSHMADDLLLIQMMPQQKVQPDKSKWMEKKKVKRCMETQQKFSFFGPGRHQCHYSGGVYVKDVMTKIPLPDKGFYSPVEVHNSIVGKVSTEMREDLVLDTDKKAEIVAVLRNYVTIAKGGGAQLQSAPPPPPPSVGGMRQTTVEMAEVLYDYDSTSPDELNIRVGDKIELIESTHPDWWTGKLRGVTGIFPANYSKKVMQTVSVPTAAPRAATGPKNYLLGVNFLDSWQVRPAVALSNTFAGTVSFQRNDHARDVSFRPSAGTLVVYVPPGVAGVKLQEIQRNQAERQARKDMERLQLQEQRKVNAAARDEQRRAEKERRLAAKKARRKEEKDKRDREYNGAGGGRPNGGKASFTARMQGGGGAGNARPSWMKASSGGATSNPAPMKIPVVPKATVPVVAKPKKKVDPNWEKFTDDDSGEVYYYNSKTGVSQWDKPKDFDDGTSSSASNGVPSSSGASSTTAAASTSSVASGSMTYKELMASKAGGYKGLDATKIETYLAASEFPEVFGMTQSEFLGQAAWKQRKAKKDAGL
eukprot:CAMPEP_0203781598 /NCGR_PEP_ID=MMETSP0099_2-20121227/10374_1 /ASSEMBLY_ACC=CAM_ASM_000209 /TAXON_ID=96639 /ORGANISM=" , Strain NY0313808BC1" /LENGTH=1398 /DNA_ID=CAMNT_0050682701 /DNA_START=78 /DNA_END=4274 /DNA_ORIENTATION=+